MNIWSITGNLGRDCNVNQVNSNSVCNFVVAVKSGYGEKEQTLWVDCALWGKKAEGRLPEFLLKGQQVAVTGELGTREYDKDGQTKTALTLRVIDVDLVGGKSDNAPAPQRQAPQQRPQQAPSNGGYNSTFDDDIPY